MEYTNKNEPLRKMDTKKVIGRDSMDTLLKSTRDRKLWKATLEGKSHIKEDRMNVSAKNTS